MVTSALLQERVSSLNYKPSRRIMIFPPRSPPWTGRSSYIATFSVKDTGGLTEHNLSRGWRYYSSFAKRWPPSGSSSPWQERLVTASKDTPGSGARQLWVHQVHLPRRGGSRSRGAVERARSRHAWSGRSYPG